MAIIADIANATAIDSSSTADADIMLEVDYTYSKEVGYNKQLQANHHKKSQLNLPLY